MEFSRKKNFVVVFILSLPFLVYFSFVPLPTQFLDDIIKKSYTQSFVYTVPSVGALKNAVPSKYIPQKLENPPVILKAIYVTSWSAGSKKYIDYLDRLFKTTQINAVVIDVKDNSGVVSSPRQIPNIDALIKYLHDQGIYVIGRVVVFQDPVLAKNRPDLAVDALWVDPSAQEVYDYNIKIAKDALSHGFDEINFDYVRFPTDGNLENMVFPKWNKEIPKNVVMKGFFKYLRQALPNEKISVDLFGQTTSNTDDMGIGQIWEDALPYFDYVSPMVYPSHYAKGYLGYKNPADYPYQIVKYEMANGLAREKVQARILSVNNPSKPVVLAKIRPWLQDFNLGSKYDARMVKEEIRAVQDALGADFNGYMLWNPLNIYTKDAIIKEK